jgi:uncharacterized RDD family membrane protein YckC
MSNLGWRMQQNSGTAVPAQNIGAFVQDTVVDPSTGVGLVSSASFLRRFAAFATDQFILIMTAALMGGLSAYYGHLFATDGESFVGLFKGIQTYLITPIYFIGFWVFTKGETPGKMLFNIRIVKVDESVPTAGTFVIRFVGYLISAVIFWLGFIWAAFDSEHQALHDKLAGTLVVKLDSDHSHRSGKILMFIVGYIIFVFISLAIIIFLGIKLRN